MIVKTYDTGNAIVHIHDDYITKDPEKIQAILGRASKIISAFYAEASAEGMEVTNAEHLSTSTKRRDIKQAT